jgi:Fe-S-cluster containining protein
VLWYLYHENVSVQRDDAGEWTVNFEARCKNLQDDLLCGVYESRPVVCREFDNQTCEVNSPAGGQVFTEPAQFLDWLRAKQPRLYQKIARKYLPPARARGGRRPR